MKKRNLLNYFSKGEIILWLSEMTVIITFFCIFDRKEFATLIASLIGVTSLIFCAKGNPIGQALIIVFSTFYGFISFSCAYYGEMITYLGMTAPMAVLSLISWIKNPYSGESSEVKVERLKKLDVILLPPLTIVVTVVLYFVLRAFGTANLLTSTISVTTSFVAAFLTFKRSPYYAIAYILNDIVLIALWSLAAIKDISYLSVIVCFIAFLANDVYTFINWKKMQKKQSQTNIDT